MSRSAREIQDWIIERLAQLTGLAPDKVDPRRPILRLGLDSFALVAFTADLEEWLGYRFRANPLEEYPTIESLARFLEEETASSL